MKIRHVSYNGQFVLHARGGEGPEGDLFDCLVCEKTSTGFRYTYDVFNLDVHCSSVSEPFVYEGHLHPLYYEHEASITTCDTCQNIMCSSVMFVSLAWIFLVQLCLKHNQMTKHPLSLCYIGVIYAREESESKYVVLRHVC